jgi:hypothetical protein
MTAKNKKYLWWGLGIAAIAGIGYWIWKDRQNNEIKSGVDNIPLGGEHSHRSHPIPSHPCEGEWVRGLGQWCCMTGTTKTCYPDQK